MNIHIDDIITKWRLLHPNSWSNFLDNDTDTSSWKIKHQWRHYSREVPAESIQQKLQGIAQPWFPWLQEMPQPLEAKSLIIQWNCDGFWNWLRLHDYKHKNLLSHLRWYDSIIFWVLHGLMKFLPVSTSGSYHKWHPNFAIQFCIICIPSYTKWSTILKNKSKIWSMTGYISTDVIRSPVYTPSPST